jgi:V/A-type H+-transporting ATPase subunit G/H
MNDLSNGIIKLSIMSSMAESKVTGIIKSLNALENDLDSLNSKVGDMKKQLSVKAQSEITALLEKTRDMATKEAEVIINASKVKATAESAKIAQEGDAKLSELQSNIDANFDEAVKHVVSTVLKV